MSSLLHSMNSSSIEAASEFMVIVAYRMRAKPALFPPLDSGFVVWNTAMLNHFDMLIGRDLCHRYEC
ncbi:MAG: hypothetical protein AAF968_19155 [Pseudomonadota bacterium]